MIRRVTLKTARPVPKGVPDRVTWRVKRRFPWPAFWVGVCALALLRLMYLYKDL